jgi:hypothetical protein
MRLDPQGAAAVLVCAALSSCIPGLVRAEAGSSAPGGVGLALAKSHARQEPGLIGSCWTLEPNAAHPEGPGQWREERERGGCGTAPHAGNREGLTPGTARIPVRPIIRSGDRLTIEDDSDRVETRLQGVALGSAAPGEIFPVRLPTTQSEMRAIALSSGRARLVNRTGAGYVW